jgi:DNA polymerase-3 subunit chi
MKKIDFHTNLPDKFLYACRLVRKARIKQNQIVILVEDYADVVKIDGMLWTFSEYDFLPHVIAKDPLAPHTPTIIDYDEEGEWEKHYQVLINLSSKMAKNFGLFERIFEIISLDDTDRNNGRDRYRLYCQQGYSPVHFAADDIARKL